VVQTIGIRGALPSDEWHGAPCDSSRRAGPTMIRRRSTAQDLADGNVQISNSDVRHRAVPSAGSNPPQAAIPAAVRRSTPGCRDGRFEVRPIDDET